jgi:hypothetical protein
MKKFLYLVFAACMTAVLLAQGQASIDLASIDPVKELDHSEKRGACQSQIINNQSTAIVRCVPGGSECNTPYDCLKFDPKP